MDLKEIQQRNYAATVRRGLITEDCTHNNAYLFHDNADYYCPDCDRYIETITKNK